jgi:hypothetical protein
MRMSCSVLLAAVLLVSGRPAAGQASLTPGDIEKATGLHGVHVVPATTPGAVPGRDNYADASGKIVLWFQSLTAAAFARAKAQPAKTMSGIEVEPKLYHAAVSGLGDEAFDSPDGKQQHALYVRKKESGFALIANLPAAGKPAVTLDQLRAIATIVLSRM